MTKNGKRRRERLRNPVAKHAHRVNKAAVHADRKNDYRRKPKHQKLEE